MLEGILTDDLQLPPRQEDRSRRVDGIATQWEILDKKYRDPVVTCVQSLVAQLIREVMRQRQSHATDVPRWRLSGRHPKTMPLHGRVACASASFPKIKKGFTPTQKSEAVTAALNKMLLPAEVSHIDEADASSSIYVIHDCSESPHGIIHLHAGLLEFEPDEKLLTWTAFHTRDGLLAVPCPMAGEKRNFVWKQALIQLRGMPPPASLGLTDKIIADIEKNGAEFRRKRRIRHPLHH